MDLINRQAAIDAIRRERKWIDINIEDKQHHFHLKHETARVLTILGKLPSAEPEIIYCKDCDQYNPEAQFCDLLQFNFLPEGHCSWGRRKGRK